MAKKRAKAVQIRLDEFSQEKLRAIREKDPMKPSLAKLGNFIIRNYDWPPKLSA